MKLPEFFGLDIGNHSLKVAQVKYLSKDTAELLKLGRIDSNQSILTATDLGPLADQVKQVKEVAGISARKVVVALPESAIFTRLIVLPEVEETKLEQSIYFEAKQYLPVPIEDVQIDWIPISKSESNGRKYIQMLLVAAPKKVVAKYVQVLDLCGLEAIAIETETIATARTFTYKTSFPEAILVMDFGGTNTDISVIKGKNVIFSQSIGTGSDVLTKSIATEFNLDIAQAEQYKRTYGLLPDQAEGKIYNALQPVMKIIVNEISRTVNYFHEHLRENTPKQVYVVGDGANLPGLAEYITTTLGIPAQISDPVSGLEMSNKLKNETSQMSTAGFTVSVGLALKSE